MPSHRRPALYHPVVGLLLELLIGSFLGIVGGLVILLTVLWVMALSGTGW